MDWLDPRYQVLLEDLMNERSKVRKAGSNMQRRVSRIVALFTVTGVLALATASPAFAEEPPFPAANGGLSTAVNQVIDHALVPGTHNAVCNVTASNPATDLVDPDCP